MARRLNVWCDRELVGQLTQGDGGRMLFQYDASWPNRPEAFALSWSLPLQTEPFTHKQCRGFFGGILPEESNRKVIARILGISGQNDFAMLERIGGECAGAVSFLPAQSTIPDDAARYRELKKNELANILRELPRRPLMAGEGDIRLSLAGAQDKLAVRLDGHRDNQVSIPRGTAPSTHVLKPAIDTYEGLVFNEAFCMMLARTCGLGAARVEIGNAEDVDYLLAERYDRVVHDDDSIHRLHQEDFCQALGVASDHKYQSEGGPSLADCFALVREASSAPAVDLLCLLDAVIFNMLIGNHDAHAKNFSLLYRLNGSTRLAPLYDVVSTVFYPELTDRMAMKIGKQPKSALVYSADVERLAADAGLGAAQTRTRFAALAKRVLAAIPGIETLHPVAAAVASLVAARCEDYRLRFR